MSKSSRKVATDTQHNLVSEMMDEFFIQSESVLLQKLNDN